VRLLLALSIPCALLAQEDWVSFRAAPFEVLASDGERQARETLNTLEQLRDALGQLLGKQDLATLWPVRIVLLRPGARHAAYQTAALDLRRENYSGAFDRGQPIPRVWLRELVRILLEANTRRMPAEIESGLETLFSTIQATGPRIQLGIPPPAAERTRDWARTHLVTVDPAYRGRARVLFSNLQQEADWRAAYKNAFEKTEQEMEAEVDRYLASAQFAPAEISGRPLNPERDFTPRPVEPVVAKVALADLLRGDAARLAYQAALNAHPKTPEAMEGLGLFAEAAAAGSRSARAWLEAGTREKDPAKARAALETAAKLNPRWAQPHLRLAALEADPVGKIPHLKKATSLEPRQAPLWQALAETHLAASQFAEAGQAWRAAENAAADGKERVRVRQARVDFETRRADLETAERRRVADEQARELQRLKDEALARVREAEARTNQGQAPADPNRKVVEWWEGPRPSAKIAGVLLRVDCIGKQARLAVSGDDKKTTQLLIRDPARIVILGGGESSLRCGPQKPPRRITVEYVSKPDAKLAVAGEALLIEFPQ